MIERLMEPDFIIVALVIIGYGIGCSIVGFNKGYEAGKKAKEK